MIGFLRLDSRDWIPEVVLGYWIPEVRLGDWIPEFGLGDWIPEVGLKGLDS